MRALFLAAALLAPALPALAQTSPTHTKRKPTHHRAATTAERPIDNGPNTPEANRAYQGGGVILEGAPGGPAPTPQATPPGQTPRGMVKP